MVKKLSAFVLAVILTASLAACGSSESGNQTQKTDSQTQESTEGTETKSDTTDETETTDSETPAQGDTAKGGEGGIVVYFSWSGNTRTIAEEIKSQTGADLFELTPATPYSTDYDTVLDEAKAEQSEDARPEIANTIENFEQYDAVYLGYPKMQYGI